MTDWNQRYEAGETPWDKGEPAPPLLEYAARRGLSDWQGLVLVPGCGRAHDVRWLAEQGLDVLGLDIAPLAVRDAQKVIAGTRARVELGDFFVVCPQAAAVIFEHTCFCAIDRSDRANYAQAAAKWLAPGGLLVGLFFLNPDNEGNGPPFGANLAELDALFSPDFEMVEEWQPQTSFPGREGREWIRVLRKK